MDSFRAPVGRKNLPGEQAAATLIAAREPFGFLLTG
jgi:hypothetical protein